MKKKLSIREIILFVILLILLVFLYLYRGPLATRRETLESERSAIQSQMNTIAPTIEQMDIWQAALDEVNAKYNGNPKSIPDYNNINAIIGEMSLIFDGDSSYTITFADPTINEHIVTRNIRITFSCYKYEEMINKLVTINDSDNKYRITDLSISQDSADLYSVSLGLIEYEYSSEDTVA